MRTQNQQLKDEINLLKGEQGKPDIKGKNKKPPSDHSSEDERKSGDKDESDTGEGKNEACAIAAYHDQTEIPVVKILICDDAPQFKLLVHYIVLLVLCWIHDGVE